MEEITTKKKKNNSIHYLIFFLITISLIAIFIMYDSPSEPCNDKYLDYCFDKNSENYKCNINDNTCDNWDIVRKIRFMEENNITIYGVKGCQWCEKQLEEFKKYSTYLYLTGMYVECNPGLFICQDITTTPTWKENGIIVHEGYIELKQIVLPEDS